MSSTDVFVSGVLALLEVVWRSEKLVEQDGDADTKEVKGTTLGMLDCACAGQGPDRLVLSSNFLKITIFGSWASSVLGVGDLVRLAVSSLRRGPLGPFLVELCLLSPSLWSSRSVKLAGLTTMWYVPGALSSAFLSRSSSFVNDAKEGNVSSPVSCVALISADGIDEAAVRLSMKSHVLVCRNLRSHTQLPTVETSWFLSTTRGVSSRKESRGL